MQINMFRSRFWTTANSSRKYLDYHHFQGNIIVYLRNFLTIFQNRKSTKYLQYLTQTYNLCLNIIILLKLNSYDSTQMDGYINIGSTIQVKETSGVKGTIKLKWYNSLDITGSG